MGWDWLRCSPLGGSLVGVASGTAASRAHARWAGLGLIAGLGLLSTVAMRQTPAANDMPPPVIRVVQPNINQNQKYDPKLERENFNRLAALTGPQTRSHAARLLARGGCAPLFLIWSRAGGRASRRCSVPATSSCLAAINFTSGETNGVIDASVLEGANNSLYAMDWQGRAARSLRQGASCALLANICRCGHCSRRSAFHAWCPAVSILAGTGASYAEPARRRGETAAQDGVQICYEIVFSGQVVDEAHRPDFIFNPSNDAWFGQLGTTAASRAGAVARDRGSFAGDPLDTDRHFGTGRFIGPCSAIHRPGQSGRLRRRSAAACRTHDLLARRQRDPAGPRYLLLLGAVAIARRKS